MTRSNWDRLQSQYHLMRPTEGLVAVLKSMFVDALGQRETQVKSKKAALAKQIKDFDRQIDSFLDKLGETTSSAATRAYERKIENLEAEKVLVEGKLAETARPSPPASEKIELALRFLANPWKLWTSDNPDHRRLVLKLGFSERLPYKRNEGYRNPQVSVIFRFLDDLTEKCKPTRTRTADLLITKKSLTNRGSPEYVIKTR